MKNNVEYEKKQLITGEEYQQILEKLQEVTPCEEMIQLNYYYDNNGLGLHQKGETLRVRQKSTGLVVERKYNKRSTADGMKICDEHEEDVEALPTVIQLEGESYRNIGNLVTVRKNFTLGALIISLDTNYYLGKMDYEIEVESDSAFTVPDFLGELVSFQEKTNGKYGRFVRQYLQMGSQSEDAYCL